MHAQPIVCLADGNLVAFELLGRTTFATDRSPEQWLDGAAREGIQRDVEIALLEAACARGAPPGGVRVFINVSASTLFDARMDDLVARLPPHVIEITEHEPVADYAALRRRLDRWPMDTTMLAIDDVGSGYSSLSHVVELRPHFVKVDRALVNGVHRDPNQLAALRGIVGYARQCGATSLAEGVESHADLVALRAVGVDLVQGFLVGQPGPGWPRPRRVAASIERSRGSGAGTGSGTDGLVGTLAQRVERLTDPHEAADEVTSHLYEHFGVLPSVYLERSERLRFVSGRGQWQVLDGIESGVGLTGAAHATGERVLVRDVARDPRYREAVPGIVAELAVPLRVDGRVVGVLNADVPGPIDDRQIAAVESGAAVLAGALARSGLPRPDDSPYKALGTHAAVVAAARTTGELAQRAAVAATEIAGLATAGMWTPGPDGLELVAGIGPRVELLTSLSPDEVAELVRLVSRVGSSYSTGPVFTRAFGPTGLLRDRGLGTVLVTAVRGAGGPPGVVVLGDRAARASRSEVVEAVELLCGLVAVLHVALAPDPTVAGSPGR
jgi:EAL domain-containing protein (putative c-di-GMP-specific phosphodiesterase class I)/putative methionine-R-sulfoxide reductase with GAF domain